MITNKKVMKTHKFDNTEPIKDRYILEPMSSPYDIKPIEDWNILEPRFNEYFLKKTKFIF